MEMEHFFESIQGWFYYPILYKEMVCRFDKGRFLEIGCWKGKSSSYLAVEIINSKKDIKLYCVDTWEGSIEHKSDKSVVNNTLYEEFIRNTNPVKDVITAIKMSSIEASKMFPESYFDFIFLDASHIYGDVKTDLILWYPKVKSGGVFAGHDYQPYWDGVQKAVNEFLSENSLSIRVHEDCWIIDKVIK